ncbi:hypothetical protein BDV29DRAFT_191637 [Aspergillus leporis]|uniref:Nucleoside phosphorylase domain-containing protein n=1 Tax=Aspergillus leporis TaxID=41062 RepID=A0A5N5WYD8_9EURO|nr:hypothetical protein BDV29DRAFT_191637 [Aspergillus leporis]
MTTIAWICALPLEMATAKVIKIHDPLPKTSADTNAYTLGKLCGHHVVIACLPSGIYGTISAADVLSHLVRTFQTIKFGLMVGIGGGVPNNSNDIRLGDVTIQGGQFEQTGMLNHSPEILLTHIAKLQTDQIKLCAPSQQTNYLFHSSYHHASKESSCVKCDKEQLVSRKPRNTRIPHIHYGLIASGDQQLGTICFEMEAAELMNKLLTLMILLLLS